ncbi:MAG TPA: helix-turn-helix domain-containing protein [Solirubrobacterales bacterium]|nr:helix-turn-helix domain-containing protein [Solirubrobacterales bacterium]
MSERPAREEPTPADLLEPQVRQALSHPLRRQIIRALNVGSAHTTTDLREVLPAENLSSLHYHVLVLEQAGVIQGSDLWNSVDAPVRSYVTEVAGDAAVASLLKATQQLDDVAGSAGAPPADRN